MRTLEQLRISPAPWKVNTVCPPDGTVGHVQTASTNAWVADVDVFFGNVDNLSLIAAAPECFASLCETLDALRNRLPSQPTVDEWEIIDRAEAAIRKATGGSANTNRRDNHVN